MTLSIFLLLLFIPPFLFALCLCYGLALKKVEKEKYDFLSYFPYELFEGEKRFWLRVAQFVWAFSTLGLSSMLMVLYRNDGSMALSYLVGISISSFLASLLGVTLSFIPLKESRDHLITFFLYGGTLSISTAMYGFFLFTLARYSSAKSSLVIFSILLWLLALASFLILCNPALLRWDRLSPQSQPDGTVRYVRPHPFVLAFSEWVLFFIQVFALFLATIGYFLA